MNASEYLQWYYLIYLLPGGAALLLLLLSVIGGGHHHGGHAHQTVGHGHHGGGRSASTGRAARQVGAFLGAGRVPPALVGGSLLLGWGLFGFWATRLLEPVWPSVFVLPAFVFAVVGALATARLTAWGAARWLPSETTTAVGMVELCGLTGTVAYSVDATRGRVHIYDAYGTLHDVSARVAPGRDMIVRGCRVLVTDYDAKHDFLLVEEVI
jgi:membrane protein implicated in regulation of membrane protease activity